MLAVAFGPMLYPAAQEQKKPATWQWPRSSPEQEGLDPAKLNELTRLIRKGKRFPRLDSLLIVRNGKLVVEEYFRGYNHVKTHTLQSVTKSFTSAMIGIAIHQGKIKGVHEKILGFFPGYKVKNMDKRKAAMKLQDLLTMRSGTDYHERGSDSPHFQLNRLPKGWDRFYLNRKMINPPGSHFLYDSGGVILMSSLLKARAGTHADGFAEEYLFKPLEIRETSWFKNSEGHPHTGGGLDLRPRDMAKFGQLYLQKGKWLGKQVVPAQWVEESTRMHVKLHEQKQGVVGYGYLWWILAPDPNGNGKDLIYAAMGFRAQYIFVIPEHNMVVVVTGDTYSYQDQRKPVNFLYSHILPALH
jgi:CubicO group peptidase (beta-lactamase class C family)